MKECFRVNRDNFDSLDAISQDRIFKYYAFDALSKYIQRPERGKEMDIFFRVITRTYTICYDTPNAERIFEIETDVIKPSQPKQHKKSKEEILIELKILVMTYINDLVRDLLDVTKPIESDNSWKLIDNFIENVFYKEQGVSLEKIEVPYFSGKPEVQE